MEDAGHGMFLDLLTSLSQELVHAVRQPSTEDNAVTPTQTNNIAAALRRLLDAQREAAEHSQVGPVAASGSSLDASAHARRQQIIEQLTSDLEEAARGLSDSIDRNTPAEIPDYCQQQPTVESVERTLSLAHRLSYTSFAPAGFVPGVTQLGNHRPPAPQELQMRAAQLHQFAMEQERAQLEQQGVVQQQIVEQPTTPALLASIPRMPPGWKPGDPLPGQLPPIPPGWKPGDALEAPAPAAAAAASQPQQPAVSQPAAEAARPPARPVLDTSFLVLNPDLEEAVEEEYSSEYSQSDED